MKEKKLKKSM
jgi:hypothetical protein